MRSVLFWGRFDPEYSRNRVIRDLLRKAGCVIYDFIPKLSLFGDLEATLRGVKRPDVVWVPCFRQRDVAAAARWARRKGIPLVFDPLISSYNKRTFERRLFAENSPKAKRLLSEERALFAKADVVIADTESHKAFYNEVLKVPENRLSVVYVGADAEFTAAAPNKRETAAPLNVLFYGSFMPLHGASTIIEAARLTQGEPVRWTLLGAGPQKPACVLSAKGLDNVVFEDPIPFASLCERIKSADVVLGVFGDTAQASRVMPNKFFQSLAVGRPVVTRESLAYPVIVAESPAVTFVPPADARALANAICGFARDAGRLEAATRAARQLYDAEFSAKVILCQLLKAIALCDTKSRHGVPLGT